MFIPSLAFAESQIIVPNLELTEEAAARRFAAPNTSNVTLRGHGGYLKLHYTSASPLDGDIAPMKSTGKFDPSDLAHFTIPAGENMEVLIDLRKAQQWSPWENAYYLAFYQPPTKTPVDMQEMTFLPAGFTGTIAAAFSHAFRSELYQVATPHALRGYRILGLSLAFLLGFPIFLVSLILLRKKFSLAMKVSVAAVLAYSLIFGLNVAFFTAKGFAAWVNKGTHTQAGQIYAIADELRAEIARNHKPTGVYVCTKATDYVTKILRYLVYPMPVFTQAEDVQKSTHIVTMGGSGWTHENDLLHCGQIDGKAQLVREFSDGSALFTTYHE